MPDNIIETHIQSPKTCKLRELQVGDYFKFPSFGGAFVRTSGRVHGKHQIKNVGRGTLSWCQGSVRVQPLRVVRMEFAHL